MNETKFTGLLMLIWLISVPLIFANYEDASLKNFVGMLIMSHAGQTLILIVYLFFHKGDKE